MKKYLSIFILSGFVSLVYSQDRVIQGKVSTLESINVAKASVKVMSTKHVVLTDTSGMFSVTCNKEDKIRIIARGFYTEKIKVNESNKFILVNIKLKPGVKNREYALGYGHVSDAEKLTAVSTLDRNEFNFSRYHNMVDLIQSQFSSVQVINNEIIIRNTNSTYSSPAALIILDGHKIDFSTLQNIYPGDVKSVNVLKDSSASMYGVQGGNGVVVITTRRGGE
jgi:TonB-dependent SusC/RagA subfamily outer membrane receptor